MRIRLRRHRPAPPSEAERARLLAVVSLARTEGRSAEVRRVSLSLREWREQNHIVAQLDKLFYGSRS